jgi:hypothetical protein
VLISNLKRLAIADDTEKNEAMDLKGQSGKFIFMVKGPPWDRKVVKVKD